jgi:peptidoglycan-N-acetylglucosamine deacetylase
MFKYTTVSILFFIIIFILLIGYQQIELSLLYLFIPVSLYIISLVLGSTFIYLNFYFNSLNKSKTENREIAITFDDGPHPIITPKLLQLLDNENAKASFFIIGKNVAANKKIIKDMADAGHIVGNHSFSHHTLIDLFSANKIADEIRLTNLEIKKITGKEPLFFRPPYGVTNPLIKKAIQATEMVPVGWSLRTLDTVKNAENVLKKLKSKTKPGSVVLFHDPDEKILEIITEYLRWLKAEQYKIVSLDKLFSIEIYENAE